MKASMRKQKRLPPEHSGCFGQMFLPTPKPACVTDTENTTSDKNCTGHRYPNYQ